VSGTLDGASPAGSRRVRRVVTGVDEQGRSRILTDTLLPLDDEPDGSFRRIALWEALSVPTSNEGHADPVPDGVIESVVPRGPGCVVRIVDVPPESEWEGAGELMQLPGVTTEPGRHAHPRFHKTDTLDVAYCIEGEVWMILDEGETLLRAGDVVVQRGTYHAWSNRSGRVCRVLIAMVAAEPLPDH
jgi:quercetin dioxygenase-like cupin family protein